MAIVKMKKFTLLTFESYKNDLLKELQKFEEVHFRNLQQDDLAQLDFLKGGLSPEAISYNEAEFSKVKFSIDKIEPYVIKAKGIKALTAPLETLDYDAFDNYLDTYDYETVYNILRDEDEKINIVKSEMTKLKAENESLRSWLELDVSPAELERMKFVKCLIGTVGKVSAESFRANVEENFKAAYVEFLGSIKDDATVLIVMPSGENNEALEYFKTLGFSKLALNFKGIPSEIISENEAETVNLQSSYDDAINNIKAMYKEYDKLKIASDYYETVLEREKACQNFLKMQKVILIDGWVPNDDSQAFKDIVTNICGKEYYLEENDVEKDSEDVPIKLKNNKLVSAFEDITVMFSLPRYNEIDPTPLLVPFYMLFFGFMIGDAGYGLLLLLGTAVALKFFNLKEGMRKFIQFFFYLSFTTIFAGIIYGSMFGFPFFTPILGGNGEYKAILDTQKDVLPMMILSVAIGLIQVLFGIAIKGYMLIRDGKIIDAVFDSLFWIITLLSAIGLILGFAGVASETIVTVSWWGFGLSLIGLALTQGRESPTIVGKIASGLFGVYGLSGYVGDLVSYTRLAALALSGAYIAFSFNLMMGLIPAGPTIPFINIGLIRLIFGGLVFLFGQALNLGLSALGAYVHTCRLQYVEFFGKFYEGGGIPFTAFKLKNKFINIKK